MKRVLIITYIILGAIAAKAQSLTYDHYMESVLSNNTALVARNMNIDIAKAAVTGSKVFNDPSLGVEYTNNEDWSKNLGQSIAAQLSHTFTFGVRSAGISLAKKELEATKAVLYDYIRNLHAEASTAYLQNLRAKYLLETACKREEYMAQLAQSDSVRFIRGEIAKTAWIETRLAAGLARNERLSAEAEYRNSAIRLGYYMGNLSNAQHITAEGTLEGESAQLESIDTYITRALEHRADLFAAIKGVEVAEAEKRLNSARRRIDLELSLGAEYNFADPSFTHLVVGAAIPLKFSNINKGARNIDRAKVEKANREVADTRLQIESEIMQAYSNCIIAEEQTKTFTRGLLNETAELLASKRKAYEQGEISFVEFIETERSENMMQEEYINALYNKAACWVELQKCVGYNMQEKK